MLQSIVKRYVLSKVNAVLRDDDVKVVRGRISLWMDRLERVLMCLRRVERCVEDDTLDAEEMDEIQADITKIVKEW